MRRLKVLCCLSFFTVLSVNAAQADPVDSLSEVNIPSAVYLPLVPFYSDIDEYGKNIIKLNLTSLAFRNISLQYERVINHRVSAALGVRLMPGGRAPMMNLIQSLVSTTNTDTLDQNAKDGIQSFYDNTKVGGFAITPEFRIYLSKMAGKGFYIAPFLRYEHANLKTVFNYESDDGKQYDINFSGKYSGTGIGFMIGAQFNLGKRVVFDWWILGPYVGGARLNMDASGFKIDDQDYADFKKTFDEVEVNFLNYKIEKSASQTDAHVSISGTSFGIRSFGFTLGVRL